MGCLLFVAAPLLVLVYYAFTNGQGQFSMVNLQNFFTDPNTLGTLCYSLVLAFVATAVCLIIAYPVAYILSQSKLKRKAVILLLFVMPMWINFTLRITALKEILSMIEGNLAYYPFINTIIGMTYDFLPFMILPLYTTLSSLIRVLLKQHRILVRIISRHLSRLYCHCLFRELSVVCQWYSFRQ